MNQIKYILNAIKQMKKEQHVQNVLMDIKWEKKDFVWRMVFVLKEKMEFVSDAKKGII
jgi:hypothetical protein